MARRGVRDLVWYFAYGSNLDPGTFEGRRRMRPLGSRRASLAGWRLVFDLPVGPGERAVANLAPDPAARVHGVAWRIGERDAWRLDRTEGVHLGYYRRLDVQLSQDDGALLAAFTYVSPHGREGRKPSARYLDLILRGARHHGLPEEWIATLERFELAVDERARGPESRRPG
jgi:cation transport regulator ChaC